MKLRTYPPLRMTFLYSPYDIWKITSKPEWYLENNLPSKWQFSIHLTILQNITSKPEWYLENYHPSEWHLSIHLMKFEKYHQNPNDTFKITSSPSEGSLFTSWYSKNIHKTRMILRKWPSLRMTVLYSPYYIWQITSKPEWHLENNLPSKWQFSIHLIIFEQKTSKPEWYLEDNHYFEWEFSIHLMILQQ